MTNTLILGEFGTGKSNIYTIPKIDNSIKSGRGVLVFDFISHVSQYAYGSAIYNGRDTAMLDSRIDDLTKTDELIRVIKNGGVGILTLTPHSGFRGYEVGKVIDAITKEILDAAIESGFHFDIYIEGFMYYAREWFLNAIKYSTNVNFYLSTFNLHGYENMKSDFVIDVKSYKGCIEYIDTAYIFPSLSNKDKNLVLDLVPDVPKVLEFMEHLIISDFNHPDKSQWELVAATYPLSREYLEEIFDVFLLHNISNK